MLARQLHSLHGATNEDLIAGFIGSVEYFNSPDFRRGDRIVWIDLLYSQVFHRQATPPEESYWNSILT